MTMDFMHHQMTWAKIVS